MPTPHIMPSEEPSKPGAPPKASGGLSIGFGTPSGTMVLGMSGIALANGTSPSYVVIFVESYYPSMKIIVGVIGCLQ